MKISIIIATYNAALTLKRCLDSIVGQLNEDVELIIVDGASPDATMEIVGEYFKYLSFVISEKDSGVYDAWNKGILCSKGDWIMFIGADDVLLPNAISAYLTRIQLPDVSTYDYICANNEYVSKNGKLLKRLKSNCSWTAIRKGMSVAHVGSLHSRRNLFDEVGLFNLKYKICSDYELLLRKKSEIKAISIPATIARMEIGGMSFSTASIIESYCIRRQHKSVSGISNCIIFFRELMAFNLFRIRKSCY